MNKVMFIGRLAKDPETRYTQDQKPVVRFNFAVTRKTKREGEADADFFPCVVMGRTAEQFDKLNIPKGTKLMIEGELRNNNYTDRNGVQRYENQVFVNVFEFCESKSNTQQTTPKKPEIQGDSEGFMPIPDEVNDDGLPFA